MTDSETTGRSFKSTAFTALVLAMLGVAMFSGTAAAQLGSGDGISADFICGENPDALFVNAVEGLIALFFVGAFLFAVLSYSANKANNTIGDSFDIDFGGKNAWKSAAALPIGVWGLTFLANAVFGIDLTCIIPFQ